MTSRRDFLRTVGLGSPALAAPGPLSAATEPSGRTPAAKPNVILILTDNGTAAGDTLDLKQFYPDAF